MSTLYSGTESDSNIDIESQGGSSGEDSEWETLGWESYDEDEIIYINDKKVKIDDDFVRFVNRNVKLEYIFNKYNMSFQERYSPSGWKYQSSCPFPDHRDSDPSFNYNKDDDRFHCFGCNRSGKVVSFVSHMHQISVYEAAEKIYKGLGSIYEISFDLPEKNDKVAETLISFSNEIRDFLLKNNKTEKAIKFAESIMWVVDIYVNQNFQKGLNIDNLNKRISFLKEKMEDYEE
jgi:DNA primase